MKCIQKKYKNMDKTKSKKAKTIQITYPAPYAQSWNVDTAPVLRKSHYGKSAKMFLFNNPKKRSTDKTWSQSYSAVRGPDPTAPHLKYGVFPNRRINSTRNLPKPIPKSVHNPHCQRDQELRNLISNKAYPIPGRKKPTKKAQSSDPPKMVIRALNNNNIKKQLSISEIMHVDIKPTKMGTGTPSFCPPHFKGLSPKVTTARSFRTPG